MPVAVHLTSSVFLCWSFINLYSIQISCPFVGSPVVVAVAVPEGGPGPVPPPPFARAASVTLGGGMGSGGG